MTTTVKKRLQAVVALLVTLMILIGIMPTSVFNMTVYAADNTAKSDAEAMASGWHWLYVQLDSKLVNGESNMGNEKLGAWGTPRIGTTSMVGISKPDGWSAVYAYGYQTWPSSITVSASTGYDGYVGYSSVTLNSPEEGHIYKIECDGGGKYMKYNDSGSYADKAGLKGDGNKSMLVGVNYFNYYYDEQVAKSYTGSGTDPNKMNITQGQVKSPYTYFNRAIMASEYGGNGGDTGYPVMYLGEYWLGGDGAGQAETGGTTDGHKYNEETTPNYVSAGIYDRNNGVTRGALNWSTGTNISISENDNKKLTNFYWGANLANRGSGSMKENYYHIVAQGLVDSELPSDLVPTYKDRKIPYFDKAFLTKDWSGTLGGNNGKNGIGTVFTSTFPLYRSENISLNATNTNTLKSSAWNDSTFKNMSLTSASNITGLKAYTFDSSSNVVRINKDNGMSEETGAVYDVDDKQGFFPFNSAGASKTQLEYGFGVRLDIRFNIGKNGKDGQDENGYGTGDGNPMIFRFVGDDDVWVFIDNKLVLDMGGGHKNAIGEINFAESEAAVLYAGSASQKDIYNKFDFSNPIAFNANVTTLLDNIRAEANSSSTGISEEHTLTMFYMERGKLNSNMSLMFNFLSPDIIDLDEGFPPDDSSVQTEINKAAGKVTEDTFTVKEVTVFDNVNNGLLDLTKKVAEDDIFHYKLQSDVVSASASGLTYPSTSGTRTSEYNTTYGTKTTTISSQGTQQNSNKIYLDVSAFKDVEGDHWGNASGTQIAIWAWDGTTNNDIVVGNKVSGSNYLYEFTIPTSRVNCLFMYKKGGFSDTTNVDGADWPAPTYRSFNATFTAGCVYQLDGKTAEDSNDSNTIKYTGAWKGTSEIFKNTTVSLQNVGGVAYSWREAFTTGTNFPGSVVNITNTDGTFNLMYGTEGSVSSAKFINQITKPRSSFRITQTGLYTLGTSGRNANSAADNSSNRSMSKYYTTTLTYDRDKGVGSSTSNAGLLTPTLTQTVEDGIKNITVTFYNYVNVGTVQIKMNEVVNKSTASAEDQTVAADDKFNVQITISNVFGISGNNVPSNGYGAIRYTSNKDSEVHTLPADGIVQLQQDEEIVIVGVPEGTSVSVEEVHTSLNKSTTSDWEAVYNPSSAGYGDHNPNVGEAIFPTENTSKFAISAAKKATNTFSGTSYSPSSVIAAVVIENGLGAATPDEPDPPVGTTKFQIKLIKYWSVTSTSGFNETGVTFLLQRSTTPSNESSWETVEEYTIDNTGAQTLSSNGNVFSWSKTITDVSSGYTYRVLEYSVDKRSLIYKTDGLYDNNCYAKYSGTLEYDSQSVKFSNQGTFSDADYVTEVTSGDVTTKTLSLGIENQYQQPSGSGMPKTGAAGVMALVTFGAFAITIAGVALLIYRKKLQTVNISAVKGRAIK